MLLKLSHFFQKNNCDDNYNSDFTTLRNSSPDISITAFNKNNENFNKNLNISELISALQNYNSKSPGPDNIPFKKLPPIGLKIFLQIFNVIWTHGFFPDQWRNANSVHRNL